MRSKESCVKKKLIKEFNYVDTLKLYKCDTPIKEIIDSRASVSIKEKQIIKSCSGYRLLVKGTKTLSICYSSDDCDSKMLSKKFSIPFFESFPLIPCIKIIDILTELCYCDIELVNCHSLLFYNVLSISIITDFIYIKPTIYTTINYDRKEKDCHFKNDCYPTSGLNIRPSIIYPSSNKQCYNPPKRKEPPMKHHHHHQKFIYDETSVDNYNDDILDAEEASCSPSDGLVIYED